MAINKVDFGSTIPGDITDWQAQIAVSQFNSYMINDRVSYDFSSNTIKKGTMFMVGGSIYLTASDTAITGTPGSYVKLTPSGSTLLPTYVSTMTGLVWNESYNYYSDDGTNAYVFDEALAVSIGLITSPKTKIGKYYDDIYTPVSVSSTQSIALKAKHNIINADVSGGDITLTISSSLEYCTFEIVPTGSNTLYIKGTGVYLGGSSLGTPVTEGYKYTGNIQSGTVYYDNNVTCEKTISSQKITQSSNGDMTNDYDACVGTISEIVTLAIAFQSLKKGQCSLLNGIPTSQYTSFAAAFGTVINTGYTAYTRVYDNIAKDFVGATSEIANCSIKGKY